MGNKGPSIYGGGDANPGGPGGHRRRIQANQGAGKKKGCCSMVAAVKSLKRRKYRLAGRYARMTVRLLAARITITARSI